jgi:hypothetical protein
LGYSLESSIGGGEALRLMFINISTLLTDSFSSSSSSFSSFFELLLRPNRGGGGIAWVGIGNDMVFNGIFRGIRVVYSESMKLYKVELVFDVVRIHHQHIFWTLYSYYGRNWSTE